jgi:response regulator RpfG family c-di-GMP phosphodiesterase
MQSKHSIIYIDDEPENLRAFKSVFRRVYNIFTTESPIQGLEYLLENKVDLIITDQRMPEMSGVDFLKRVNEFLPGKPPCRMIYSGYSKTKEIDLAKENKWMSFFVSKPCDPEDLKAKIDSAIRDCQN